MPSFTVLLKSEYCVSYLTDKGKVVDDTVSLKCISGLLYLPQATFCGSSLGDKKGLHFSVKDFESMGYHFCDTLLDYCDPDNSKVEPRTSTLVPTVWFIFSVIWIDMLNLAVGKVLETILC